MSVRLRAIQADDLPTLYYYQLDAKANDMAATLPRSRDQFDVHWSSLLNDADVTARAILCADQLVGSISCYRNDQRQWLGYWLGSDFWGNGIASRAVELFLAEMSDRPLFARVAAHNSRSLRVLLKSGFVITATSRSPADERFQECLEAWLRLD